MLRLETVVALLPAIASNSVRLAGRIALLLPGPLSMIGLDDDGARAVEARSRAGSQGARRRKATREFACSRVRAKHRRQ